jgi:hypothetical protein
VEEISHHSVVHIVTACCRLRDLKLENCSFVVDTVNPLTEEQLEEIELSVPPLLELRAVRVVNRMPLEMVLLVLRPALNIVTIEVDSADGLTDSTVLRLMEANRLLRLEELSIAASK